MFCSFACYFRFSILLCTSSEGNLDCAMLCISVSRAKRLALSCKMLDSNDDSRRLRRRWGKGDNTEILFTRFKLRVKFIFYVASCCCVVVVCIYSIYSSSLGWWDAQPNGAWKMVMKVVQNHNEMIYFFYQSCCFHCRSFCFAFIVWMGIFRWTGAECHLFALSYQHILFWDCLNISWTWAELCRRGHQKVSAFSVCANMKPLRQLDLVNSS